MQKLLLFVLIFHFAQSSSDNRRNCRQRVAHISQSVFAFLCHIAICTYFNYSSFAVLDTFLFFTPCTFPALFKWQFAHLSGKCGWSWLNISFVLAGLPLSSAFGSGISAVRRGGACSRTGRRWGEWACSSRHGVSLARVDWCGLHRQFFTVFRLKK